MKKHLLVLLLSMFFLISGIVEIAAGIPEWRIPSPTEKLFLSLSVEDLAEKTGELHLQENEIREERTPREENQAHAEALITIEPGTVETEKDIPITDTTSPSALHYTFPFNKAPPCTTR